MGVRDAEQASLFVEVLRNEVADLHIRLGEAERKWEQRQKTQLS
jgi:O-succinylbenzoate synthase